MMLNMFIGTETLRRRKYVLYRDSSEEPLLLTTVLVVYLAVPGSHILSPTMSEKLNEYASA